MHYFGFAVAVTRNYIGVIISHFSLTEDHFLLSVIKLFGDSLLIRLVKIGGLELSMNSIGNLKFLLSLQSFNFGRFFDRLPKV